MTAEERIAELEARLAWFEKAQSDLDEVLRQAHDRIDRLEREMAELREQAQRGAPGLTLATPEEEVPPHYGRM